MGAAAPRFEMAHMLGVDERDVPTEAVHYELPHGVWMPALLGEREDQPGAVLWENGRLYVWGEGQGAARRDVTLTLSMEAEEEEEEEDRGGGGGGAAYFGGRSTVRIRPTPAFYRPGVVVTAAAADDDAAKEDGAPRPLLGVVGPFDPSDGRYPVHWQRRPHAANANDGGGLNNARLTPYEVQARVLLPDTELRCDVGCIREQRVELQRADGSVHRVMVAGAANDDDDDAEPPGIAVCFLDYQGDGEEEANEGEGGILGVRMPRLLPGGASASAPGGLFGASHGARVRRAYEERYAPRTRVHIDGVALPLPSSSAAQREEGARLFVRCRHLAGGGV